MYNLVTLRTSAAIVQSSLGAVFTKDGVRNEMMLASSQVDLLCESIANEVLSLLTSNAFLAWADEEKLKADDLIIFNNSFFYREGLASIPKSAKYLCVSVDRDAEPSMDVSLIVNDKRLNKRFSHVAARQVNQYRLISLKSAVKDELSKLGTIIFAIAGRIGEDLPTSTQLSDAADLTSLSYEPSQSYLVVIQGEALTINALDDIDKTWKAVESAIRAAGVETSPDFSVQFKKSFEDLREKAGRPVYIDDVREEYQSILSDIIKRLDQQVKSYADAYKSYARNAHDKEALNELLRIAYNFADGAIAVMTLVVGISDMKPLICWLMMRSQSELTDRFDDLPFSLLGKDRPSFGLYRSTIAGARNRAFHDVFAFERQFQIGLTGDAIRDAEIRMFQEYSKRAKPGFNFKDRELVDLLTSFTRTSESPVPAEFWEGNLDVMKAVVNVARSLHRALLLAAGSPVVKQ